MCSSLSLDNSVIFTAINYLKSIRKDNKWAELGFGANDATVVPSWLRPDNDASFSCGIPTVGGVQHATEQPFAQE
jgi:hypothetical protein